MNQQQATSQFSIFKMNQTAVLRMVWFVLALLVLGVVLLAIPYRYQMLADDVYGFGPGLAAIGLSLTFFATYFVFWELVVFVGALAVAAFIVWRHSDTPYAMLVATSLTLLVIVLPLLDGLMRSNPFWHWLIIALRVCEMICLMAVFCLFPNGRFQPKWTRWLLVSWIFTLGIVHLINPNVLANTAVLPNTRTLADASYLLIGVSWFMVAIGGQMVRYKKFATAEEQQQSKWVLFGFILLIFISLVSAVLLINVPFLRDNPQGHIIFILVIGVVYLLSALLLPVTIAFAMLRYDLWKVDIFINRTLVYGGLMALITAVYVLLVGGITVFTTNQSGQVVALIIATLIVFFLIAPAKRSLQQGVDRLLPRPPQINTAVLDSEQATMHGHALQLARLLWLGILLLSIVMFAVSTAVISEQNLWGGIIDGSFPIDIALLQNTVGFVSSSAIWIISYVQLFAFVSMGLLLFARKSNDRMGILASSMLIAIGFGFTANIVLLPILIPEWHLIVTIYQAIMFGSIVLFLFWFPNGRFYPHWTKFLAAGWFVYTILWFFWPELNPHRAPTIWPIAIWMGWIWLGVATQFRRFHHYSDAAERQQTKWVISGFVGANMGLFVVILILATGLFANTNGRTTALFSTFLFIIAGTSAVLIPFTISVALFRYRLWEIDFFINRTVVYGGLTFLVLFIYALLVGSLSTLFQTQNSLFISLIATGLIAVLFQPVRARLQQTVNRLMFGERDDPYGVLSRLGQKLQETAVPEQTLLAITATIIQTLKLPYAAIELDGLPNEQNLIASSGEKIAETESWPLLYRHETIGWLRVAPRSPREAFTQKEQRLLADIATQAGAATYSVRLTMALKKSRENLVLTREEERRRIRRDLHDELGPSLASQTFSLDAAIDLLKTDPQAAVALLKSLKTQNQGLVGDIRRLVYELRPPALDDLGLMGALQAHLSQIDEPPMTLTAVPDPLPPLPAAVEVAAYRIVLEATNNVVRHAQAQACTIQIEADDTRLTLTISDDGVGLPAVRQNGVGLTSMRERAEELGGTLLLGSLAEGGVRITAVLPIV